MDPNLQSILKGNKYQIQHGSIQKACFQAEDYLTYILGFDQVSIKQELDMFAQSAKRMRKEKVWQKRRENHARAAD